MVWQLSLRICGIWLLLVIQRSAHFAKISCLIFWGKGPIREWQRFSMESNDLLSIHEWSMKNQQLITGFQVQPKPWFAEWRLVWPFRKLCRGLTLAIVLKSSQLMHPFGFYCTEPANSKEFSSESGLAEWAEGLIFRWKDLIFHRGVLQLHPSSPLNSDRLYSRKGSLEIITHDHCAPQRWQLRLISVSISLSRCLPSLETTHHTL